MSGGGGGIQDIGHVTAGMAVMNFDQKTKPYTRADFIAFLQNYETNLNATEQRLIERGMAGTLIGMPVCFVIGYVLSGRLGWQRLVRAVAPPVPAAAAAAGGVFRPATAVPPSGWAKYLPLCGRVTFGLGAASLPYLYVQQWFLSSVLALDERENNLCFHVKRLMLAQRSGMMFSRTATREVTREEQSRLMQEAERHVQENRSGTRQAAGLGTGAPDVNMQLGGMVLTPVAQTGYKPMPK
ncbi:hypothetical protein STCU_04845 [Strigomonas culicis]|uniref:Uncharacterized protein n=1 Tax=Strigomonas culicis TaxID=28005 RepID=S9UJC0_9TRYP|nr:hypothetical protein STCU_04845 [Strigomonas culicis]|eukprot:EPY28859.1 hypothetical protein STCU_04845 [Strigomonas culicis]